MVLRRGRGSRVAAATSARIAAPMRYRTAPNANGVAPESRPNRMTGKAAPQIAPSRRRSARSGPGIPGFSTVADALRLPPAAASGLE
jgi:hypothetical protein